VRGAEEGTGGVNLLADLTRRLPALVTAKSLNAAGLLIALAAAILMAFYPPRLRQRPGIVIAVSSIMTIGSISPHRY
jgi:hypothetical protein